MNTYDKERKQLLDTFLEEGFFKYWRDPENNKDILFNGVELQITSGCNLDCDYCYYAKNSELNPLSAFNREELLKNTDLIIEWWDKNKFFPDKIDIFSGEPLIHQNITFDIIKKIIDYMYSHNKSSSISIPTNMTWVAKDEIVRKVRAIIQYAQSKNCKVHLSASVDGKYMDVKNRAYIKNSKSEEFYSDEYYDKLFKIAKEFKCGFHPMIHRKNIGYAIKNFLWFQEMFKKHGIPPFNIYLLEVRNAGWTKHEAKELKNFFKFVCNWALHTLLKGDKDTFINNFLFGKHKSGNRLPNMNLFSELSTHGRGIGCSLQTTMQIRLQDLQVNSCHRMSYKSQMGFKLVPHKDKGLDPIPLNFDFYMATMSYDVKSAPYCQECILKYSCSGGCLGSNFESTGDWFTPHRTVCLLEHAKHLAQVEFFVENNIFNEIVSNIREDKAIAYKSLKKWRYGNE